LAKRFRQAIASLSISRSKRPIERDSAGQLPVDGPEIEAAGQVAEHEARVGHQLRTPGKRLRRLAFLARLRSAFAAFRFSGRDFLSFVRRPAVFLLGALLCVFLTFVVKITRNAAQTVPAASIAQAAAAEVEAAPADPAGAAAAEQPAPAPPPKAAPLKLLPQEEQKKAPRTVPLEQLEALTDAKPKSAIVPTAPPAPQPEASPNPPLAAPRAGFAPRLKAIPPIVGVPPGGMNPIPPQKPVALRAQIRRRIGGVMMGWPIHDGLTDFEPADFTKDAQTGVLFSKDGRWHASKRYNLPIEDQAIERVRMRLMATRPVVELQWWFPRTIEIPEEHFKGKVAKLRFLAAISDVDSQMAEGSLRVLRTHGTNPGGIALVEADALFYLPHLPDPFRYARNRPPQVRSLPEIWQIVPTSVAEKPGWFVDGKSSVKRGDVGPLPVSGAEIDAVRKAVRASEEGRIHEVKFWPPRVEATTHHRLSQLRYEVVTDRDISLEEAVFDHTKGALAYLPLADDVFPEDDKHATSLGRAAK
jgi:hypothetical protein